VKRARWSSKGGVVRLSRDVISSVSEVSLLERPRTGRLADDGRFYY
jgi:hypothetical protein